MRCRFSQPTLNTDFVKEMGAPRYGSKSLQPPQTARVESLRVGLPILVALINLIFPPNLNVSISILPHQWWQMRVMTFPFYSYIEFMLGKEWNSRFKGGNELEREIVRGLGPNEKVVDENIVLFLRNWRRNENRNVIINTTRKRGRSFWEHILHISSSFPEQGIVLLAEMLQLDVWLSLECARRTRDKIQIEHIDILKYKIVIQSGDASVSTRSEEQTKLFRSSYRQYFSLVHPSLGHPNNGTKTNTLSRTLPLR
ncbi:hypothetical protein ONS95_015043 [Cadophora gregata]|uniref:uncharacterized protein n=1 Tax=Cadophora gregata TaxID=51156 RepID=UPI0026DBC157|nr:uncharacterized protein ONS95_015043 [Cadophora gregata]KAK0118570.1 hypothetical protein ONS96_014974 [Cadophora gregata f. sp. sojae]KAK0125825.1 hypothetical protein ONS95_015043 [Cadophora gregata]